MNISCNLADNYCFMWSHSNKELENPSFTNEVFVVDLANPFHAAGDVRSSVTPFCSAALRRRREGGVVSHQVRKDKGTGANEQEHGTESKEKLWDSGRPKLCG